MRSTCSDWGFDKAYTGVYIIICKINKKRYVGSSKQIHGRLHQHFNREPNLYPHKPLYEDINKYGKDNFEWDLLEECDEKDLLTREQYWYDKLQPEYNLVRPGSSWQKSEKAMELHPDYKKEIGEHLKEKYSTQEYKTKFKEINRYKFVPVDMFDLDGNYIMSFECVRDAHRWLDENTDFKAKNKSSKILENCKGKKKTCFGYIFKYKNIQNSRD